MDYITTSTSRVLRRLMTTKGVFLNALTGQTVSTRHYYCLAIVDTEVVVVAIPARPGLIQGLDKRADFPVAERKIKPLCLGIKPGQYYPVSTKTMGFWSYPINMNWGIMDELGRLNRFFANTSSSTRIVCWIDLEGDRIVNTAPVGALGETNEVSKEKHAEESEVD
jgi:hypothetical protein